MPMTTRPRKLPVGFWKGSSAPARRARRAVKSLAPRTRKAVATIAKRVLNRRSETKYRAENLWTGDGIAQIIYGDVAPTGVATQLFRALPTLAIGDGGYQRDGQKVNPVKHTMELDFAFNNQTRDITNTGGLDACSWDLTVHVWYGYAHRYKSLNDVTLNSSAIVNEMYELGNGNSGRFTGAPFDILKKINTDVLSVKRKSFRMFRPLGAQNQATLSGGLTTYFPQLIKKHITLAFKPPKTLMYDESYTVPENYAPFIIIGYEHNDPTQAANTQLANPPTTILQAPAIQVQGLMKLWYKDS